jgi:hypothetical protein
VRLLARAKLPRPRWSIEVVGKGPHGSGSPFEAKKSPGPCRRLTASGRRSPLDEGQRPSPQHRPESAMEPGHGSPGRSQRGLFALPVAQGPCQNAGRPGVGIRAQFSPGCACRRSPGLGVIVAGLARVPPGARPAFTLGRTDLSYDSTLELISGRPPLLSHRLSFSLVGPSPQSEDAGICKGELEALRTHGALCANLARRHAVFGPLGLHELIAPEASARSSLKPFGYRHISNRVPRRQNRIEPVGPLASQRIDNFGCTGTRLARTA